MALHQTLSEVYYYLQVPVRYGGFMTELEKLFESLDQVNRQLRRGKRQFHRGGYRLLRFIQQQGQISTKEISEKLGLRISSINERLIRYEEEQLIERFRNPEDKRVFIIKITDLGKEKLEQFNLSRQATRNQVKTILTSKEIVELTQLLGKLSKGLEEGRRIE